jgi:hypothetical protein
MSKHLKHIDPRAGVDVALPRCSWRQSRNAGSVLTVGGRSTDTGFFVAFISRLASPAVKSVRIQNVSYVVTSSSNACDGWWGGGGGDEKLKELRNTNTKGREWRKNDKNTPTSSTSWSSWIFRLINPVPSILIQQMLLRELRSSGLLRGQ